MASPGWAMVERVVDSVLESLPDPLRILCDRSGILVALEGMGAISLPLRICPVGLNDPPVVRGEA